MGNGAGKGLLDALLTPFLVFTSLLFPNVIDTVPCSLLLPGHAVLFPLSRLTKIS